ncbi:MAG: ABC transporter substrate-binding protein [Thermomicrobiales bacterium]|nr:ABC transporter substrate-binding protein [Thermomicrobiales bacterium]
MHRRHFVSAAAGAIAFGSLGRFTLVAAQGTPTEGETREITDARGTTFIPANPQRIVALGEEFLLADLLELGIKPAESSANFLDGYLGIDPELTEGLTPFTLWDADLEMFVALEPDLVLVPQIYWDVDPDMFELISQMAPTVVLPSTDSWQDDFRFLASIFDLEALADEKIAELDAFTAETKEALALDGQTVTFATVYSGGTDITLWTTPQTQIVEVGVDIGLTIMPDAADFEPDRIGRVYISLEQALLITGDTLIMLQTTGGILPEEEQVLQEVLDSDVFKQVPAVQNGRVFTLERVGFPGQVMGRRRLLEAYTEIFGGDSATPTAG